MDLTYITERIIAMTFPNPGMDVAYRKSLKEVTRMLQTKHGDNYLVINLSDRRHDLGRLNRQVLDFGWPDRLAPPLERLCSICKAMDSWLNTNPQHIVILHSKGGKDRTGVVIAAYMHYSNICASADQALDRFAMRKFYDDKLGGLSQPSQRRYVQYFSGLLSGAIKINSSPLFLHQVIVQGVPNFDGNGGCKPFLKIYQGMQPIYTSGVYTVLSNMRRILFTLLTPLQLRGDILIKCYHRSRANARDVIFRVQFHTCAVSDFNVIFPREELDDACQDPRFPEPAAVELKFSSGTEFHHSNGFINEAPLPVDNSADTLVRWDSYENFDADVDGHLEDINDMNTNDPAVNHTTGPVDGSLYATVAKRKVNGLVNGVDGLSDGPQSTSMDSGISSASGHIATTTTGSTPPHSGQSSATSNSLSPGTTFQTHAEVHHHNVINNNINNNNNNNINNNNNNRNNMATSSIEDEQSKLDELLNNMLMGVESIPDVRSTSTSKPTKHVTYCFSDSITSNGPKKIEYTTVPPTGGQSNGYATDTVDNALNTSPHHQRTKMAGSNSGSPRLISVAPSMPCSDPGFVNDDEMPYHGTKDSKPFTYGLLPGSPAIERRATGQTIRPGSPPLIKTTLSTTLGLTPSSTLISRSSSPPKQQVPSTPPIAAPRTASPTKHATASPSRLDRLEESRIRDISSSPDSSRRGYDSDTGSWLERQQQKLRDRQEARIREERQYKEQRLIYELRSTQHHYKSPEHLRKEEELDRTLASLEALDLDQDYAVANGTRENGRVTYSTPLHINTYNGYSSTHSSPYTASKPPIYQAPQQLHNNNKGNSAPSSPLIPSRTSSREVTKVRYAAWQPHGRPIQRQRSDTSHDRDRPFVAIKRAHEQARKENDTLQGSGQPSGYPIHTSTPIYQQVFPYPPHGAKVPERPNSPGSSGLLTLVNGQATSPGTQQLDELEMTLRAVSQSSQDPNSRPWSPSQVETSTPQSSPSKISDQAPTPTFPVYPRTPYVNQESALRTSSPISYPPKSPTLHRSDRSPSPHTLQQIRAGFISEASNFHAHTLNGQSSPTVYYGQSRRSSLTSLNEPIEVINHHPMFVKDTSKFWYKPHISREEAINLLRDKPPGSFVVRDSNSFPGAYGLALKVSTPPPNVQSKSGDASSELVRHFLIEPTAKGVRLKGCSNEPVFGSLSALVYQHSITPLALPCKLVLPVGEAEFDKDVLDSTTVPLVTSTTQLLAQGAACNVLYLFSVDMESLTGPQAIRKAVAAMLGMSPLPSSTIVHFKVSSQGITLTDNNRKLFFRRHYPVSSISHCGLDPEDRLWEHKNEEGIILNTQRIFGFIARKPASKTDNQCHIFAELEPEQPATAIVNFVTKVMMSGNSNKATFI